MSDGPHKSLPMRGAWKRFAERAAKHSYDVSEVCEAAEPALAWDWRDEIAPSLLDDIRHTLSDGLQGNLFSDDTRSRLDALRSRPEAASPLARALLDYVGQAVAEGVAGEDALCNGANLALVDAGQRRARQIEEHYLRAASARDALRVRARLEQGFAQIDYPRFARDVLRANNSLASNNPAKRSGLDDGVALR